MKDQIDNENITIKLTEASDYPNVVVSIKIPTIDVIDMDEEYTTIEFSYEIIDDAGLKIEHNSKEFGDVISNVLQDIILESVNFLKETEGNREDVI
jgi:hypothetical protein